MVDTKHVKFLHFSDPPLTDSDNLDLIISEDKEGSVSNKDVEGELESVTPACKTDSHTDNDVSTALIPPALVLQDRQKPQGQTHQILVPN